MRLGTILLLSATVALAACHSHTTEEKQKEQQAREQTETFKELLTAAAQRENDAGIRDQ